MKLKNYQHYLPQLLILKQVVIASLSLRCTSNFPRPLLWLVIEATIFASPLPLLVEVSSIQHSLLEGYDSSPHFNDGKKKNKKYIHSKMEMEHHPLLSLSHVPLLQFPPHNLHTLYLPCFPSCRRPYRDLCDPPFSFLLHGQSLVFTLTIHISKKFF